MHSAYIVPGIVDGAVVEKQAEDRSRDKRHPEPTFVHYHKMGNECNEKCHTVQVGSDDVRE